MRGREGEKRGREEGEEGVGGGRRGGGRRERGEKGRDLTQSYDKSPYTNRNVKRAK